MNVGSLFSGVGGFDLGLERAGHKIAFQCEADTYRRQVLAHHWPGVPISPDVREVTPEWLRGELSDSLAGDGGGNEDLRQGDIQPAGQAPLSLDLICGGFPCQDLSVAGKRAGLAGERSGLFFEAARVADAFLRDGGWLLIENVPGLLSSNDGRDFAVVLATLADLGFHDLAWRVLDSRYFGVPQRRRRVFILARRSSGRHAAEVLLEPESGGGNHQASQEAGKSAPSTLGVGIAGTRGSGDVAPAVTSKWRKGSGGPAGDECQNLVSPSIHPEHEGRGSLHRPEGRRRPHSSPSGTAGDEADQLPASGAVSSPPDTDGVREASGVSGRVDDPAVYGWADEMMDRPRENEMGTIRIGTTVGAPTASIVFDNREGVSIRTAQTGANGWGIRQGEVGTLDKSMGQAICSPGRDAASCPVDYAPDGPRYAAMGDAVTVNVAEWIGYRLREFG